DEGRPTNVEARRRRSSTAMVHHGTHIAEQAIVRRLLDGENGLGQVAWIDATPAARNHGASAPKRHGFLENTRISLRTERHGAKTDIDRRFTRGEKLLEFGRRLPVIAIAQVPVSGYQRC